MYFLYKVVQVALLPAVWVFVAFLAIALLLRNPARVPTARRISIVAAALWIVLATPAISSRLAGFVERGHAPVPLAGVERREAIVVLGGGSHRTPGTGDPTIANTQTLDRLVEGIALYRAGAAPLLLVSGGVGDPLAGTPPEGPAAIALAESLGVPHDALEAEGASRTTAENAADVRKAHPGMRRIWLVTSAIHMTRSAALFRKQGFEVKEAPSDWRSTPDWLRFDALVPGPVGLADSTAALHETAGYLASRLAGQL